jgi:phytoene dehydrogenase-like protein
MTKVDVAVVGAGAAGLTAGALLAAEGARVAVFEASPWLGGRGMAVPDEGFRINVGAHLLEDSGSGITRIFEHVGKTLEHGAVSDEMPVWQDDRWVSIREFYSGTKDELKKVIVALLETPFAELDKWDDRPLRDWMLQHTRDEGVIALWEYLALLECLTDEWYDHSASDNLYVRKMHYAEKRMAGYSFWPAKGWDGLFQDLADAVAERGGEVRLGTPVERVVIEDGRVVGVAVARGPRIIPNEMFEDEVVEAECVISTLPVWNVLRVVPEQHLPDWYAAQIRFLARDELRVAWAGLYIATDEPVFALSERELSTWFQAPVTGAPGFFFNMTAMDPSVSPPGTHLHVAGSVLPGAKGRDQVYLQRRFEDFEEELARMYPGLRKATWRRRHLVFDPAFGVIQKPGLVGVYRPHWRAPNVEGLLFASETFRSRGIGVDRAARAALTAVEDYLGRRIAGFEETWRY